MLLLQSFKKCFPTSKFVRVSEDGRENVSVLIRSSAYGCTELSGAIVQSGVRDKDLSIVGAGTPISNVEIRFWNEKLQDAGAKGPGEILIRGPNLMM